MKEIIIHSVRNLETWPSWDLVYEWEDEMVDHLERTRLSFDRKLFSFFDRLLCKLALPINGLFLMGRGRKALHFVFEMSAKTKPNIRNRANVVPAIIDFFLLPSQYDDFCKAYDKNPLVLISSREVYETLKKHNLKLNLVHWALSLPDKYALNVNIPFEKKYHFTLVGRVNPVLKAFLQKYEASHPNLVYVFEGKEKFHYYTNKGEYVGYFKSRAEYIRLIRMAKMALYATPAMDNSRVDANGFNQVTPKFLEYISVGCQLLLRYPDNPDTRYFDLNSFCPSIETYEQFSQIVDNYMDTVPDLFFYATYLKKHYTSARVKELRGIIDNK